MSKNRSERTMYTLTEKLTQKLELESLPMWVRFSNLRYHYFNPYLLNGLGRLIGKPMFMDKLTTSQARMAYARVYIEIKAGPDPNNNSLHC